MTARVSGIPEKSNKLTKCFIFLAYLFYYVKKADGRSHFLFYRQEASSSEALSPLLEG